MSEGGPALGTGASRALAITAHDKGEPWSRLSQVYCRWPVACSPSATLQKELMEDNGPDLMGCRGMGDYVGAGLSRREPAAFL